MNEQIITQLRQERDTTAAQLKRLETALAALQGTNGVHRPLPAVKVARTGRKRAPRGYLEEAMMAALKGTPGLTNQEVRQHLAQDGYKYSLSPLHVGKRLMQLTNTKQLKAEVKNGRYRYYPTK